MDSSRFYTKVLVSAGAHRYNGNMVRAVTKALKMPQRVNVLFYLKKRKKGGSLFLNRPAFTLFELISVIIIVTIMAAFAIPNYMKAMRKGHERNMAVNLMTIHGANEIYRAKSGGNDEYLPGAGLDLAGINAGLSLNIIDNNAVYEYTRATATMYDATATLGGGWLELRLSQNPASDSNPCCSAGDCRVKPGC